MVKNLTQIVPVQNVCNESLKKVQLDSDIQVSYALKRALGTKVNIKLEGEYPSLVRCKKESLNCTR